MATFDPTTPEQWYPIPSIPGFEVSSHYCVRRWVTAYGNPRPAGSILVNLRVKPKGGYQWFEALFRAWYLHRVVKEVDLGRSLRRGEMVLHKDDDRSNNHPSNLKIGNHTKNVADAHRNQRYRKGAENGHATLDEAKIVEIRKLAADGLTQAELGRRFKVRSATISRIVSRKSWSHVV